MICESIRRLFLFVRNREDALQVYGWFAVLDTLRDNPEGQGFYLGDRLFTSCSVYHDTGEVGHLGDASAVIFSIYFDGQYRHDRFRKHYHDKT